MSFLLSRFPVPNSLFVKVNQVLSSLSPVERRFVLHVLVSNVINVHKARKCAIEGWIGLDVDLPSGWIRDHFGRALRVDGIGDKFLAIQPYSTAMHQCRSFRVSERLLDLVLTWALTHPASVEDIVNVFDGKPYTISAPKQWDEGIFSPKLVRNAIGVIDKCPFDDGELSAHLSRLENAVRQARGTGEGATAEGRLANDAACALRIRAGSSASAGIREYRPEYRTSYTGRIIEIGGGAQSCSRAMKRALFDGISKSKNYDLKRAQAFILLQEL